MWWSQKFPLQHLCPHHWGSAAPANWSQVSGIIWPWSWPKMWRRAAWSPPTSMASHLGLERYDEDKKKQWMCILKSLSFNLYFPRLPSQMRYIQPFPGHYVSMDPTAVIDVYGLIGTPAMWKEHAALVWRVGPAYLFEEALSPESIGVIYTQGTAYVGNFQALRTSGGSHDQRVIPVLFQSIAKARESLICASLRPTTLSAVRCSW